MHILYEALDIPLAAATLVSGLFLVWLFFKVRERT